MTNQACADVRREIEGRALGDGGGPVCRAEVAVHLAHCPECARLQAALTGPPAMLASLFGPSAPPARARRRILQAAGVGRRLPWSAWAAAAAASVAAAVWLALGAVGQAAIGADRATLVAAVWSSQPPVAAYQTEGIGGSVWPVSPRGAGMVCRLHDGRWLVSLLVHNVPADARLREVVDVGAGRLTRLLSPVGNTVLDVAAVPPADGPVRAVALWETVGGGTTRLAGWRVNVAPAGAAAYSARSKAVWNG